LHHQLDRNDGDIFALATYLGLAQFERTGVGYNLYKPICGISN
jgi:hypothetical protein